MANVKGLKIKEIGRELLDLQVELMLQFPYYKIRKG